MANTKVSVLYTSSEVYPYSKTGGLADVAGSLPVSLKRQGVDIIVISPYYSKFKPLENRDIKNTGISFDVWIDGRNHTVNVLESVNKGVKVYLIANEKYFGRDGIYGENSQDYPDNALRFALLNYAALELIKLLGEGVDIIHINDWQTSLIPVIFVDHALKQFENTGIFLTVHNLAYQGIFPPEVLPKIRISYHMFHMEALEFYGSVNFLKGGLIFSDIIGTVSPSYALEIQTPEFGHRLDGVLRKRSKDVLGIVNGLDYDVWNPETDQYLFINYGLDNLTHGKNENKRKLQESCGLTISQDVPLFGLVSRLVEQKGIDLLVNILEDLLNREVQFVILGAGNPDYENKLQSLRDRYKKRLFVKIGFDPVLANRIYAGSDFFLMPSRYEPCGLGQLIAMRYGSIPVVRATGGLKDTVIDLSKPNGYGILFNDYSEKELKTAILRALNLFRDSEKITSLRRKIMSLDFSWDRSAKEYINVYEKLIRSKEHTKFG